MVRNIITALFLFSFLSGGNDLIQPYLLIGESGKSVDRTADDIIRSIFMEGNIEILGKYHPFNDPNQYVMVVSNSDLIKAVENGKESGGFLSAIRIAITRQGEMTYISCQNPEYWGNVFFQDDYPKVAKYVQSFTKKLMKSMPRMRGKFKSQFGMSNPISVKKLRHYHYKFRMPTLEDITVLGKFNSYEEAKQTVEKNLKSSKICEKVFEIEIANKRIKLYGIDLSGGKVENSFIPILEKGKWKQTAFLPFEIIIVNNEVRMLPGRFRIPVSFPDMRRRTFKKIRAVSDDIESVFKTLIQ